MKDARSYVTEFDPALERLEPLIEKAQRDAYNEGYRAAADQMFEIAKETTKRVDKLTHEALA